MPAKSSDKVIEPSLEDIETADEKRLRLARAYLGTLAREVDGEGGDDESEEDEDAARGVIRSRPATNPSTIKNAISNRLHQDALLVSGSFFRPASFGLQAAGLSQFSISFHKAHKVRIPTVFYVIA